MNIYIMVDIEGISGIYTREQTKKDGLYFDEGRDYMTAEVNACAEACKAAGADKVYVRDAHNNGSFIRWEKLSPAVDAIVKGGAGYLVRFTGLGDCDGVILLGYHAMTGTKEAVIAHTMDLDNRYIVGGTEFGEIAIDAALSTEQYQKPIIMVSGDDKACAEAKRFLPWATTCEVKRGLDFDKAFLLAPEQAYARVKEKTIEAIENLKNARLFPLPSPITVEQSIPDRPRRIGTGATLTEALLNRREVTDQKEAE